MISAGKICKITADTASDLCVWEEVVHLVWTVIQQKMMQVQRLPLTPLLLMQEVCFELLYWWRNEPHLF